MRSAVATSLQLVTRRLILRPWQDRDRATFAAPMTGAESEEALSRYNMQIDRDGFTMFAAEHRETGTLAGVIGMQTMRTIAPNLPRRTNSQPSYIFSEIRIEKHAALEPVAHPQTSVQRFRNETAGQGHPDLL